MCRTPRGPARGDHQLRDFPVDGSIKPAAFFKGCVWRICRIACVRACQCWFFFSGMWQPSHGRHHQARSLLHGVCELLLHVLRVCLPIIGLKQQYGGFHEDSSIKRAATLCCIASGSRQPSLLVHTAAGNRGMDCAGFASASFSSTAGCCFGVSQVQHAPHSPLNCAGFASASFGSTTGRCFAVSKYSMRRTHHLALQTTPCFEPPPTY